MTDTQTGRMQKQDNWKRTQVRMPQEQYTAIANYAKANNISLNSAMLELMAKGLTPQNEDSLAEKIAKQVADILQKKAP